MDDAGAANRTVPGVNTNAPVPLTSLKINLVRFLGQSTNHAVAEALDRMAPIRPDAVSRNARAGREGRTPAPSVRLLTQSKRLPGGLEPLVTDFAKGRLPDDYKPEQPSADALARGDGIRVVRGIGAFRETAKTLIASASAGTRPTGMPLQSGGKN